MGTALSLLKVEKQDPHATVVLLPADHYVDDETTLAQSLAALAVAAEQDPRSIYLLGAQPDAPDSELGYIVPEGTVGPITRTVAEFVEKPNFDEANQLIAEGALWNMFIVAAPVRRLLSLLENSYNFVAPMRMALSESAVGGLSRLYEDLPAVDFSRDVLAHFPHELKVLSVPPCGWTDLGTPKRVAETVRKSSARYLFDPPHAAMYLDLAKAVGAI